LALVDVRFARDRNRSGFKTGTYGPEQESASDVLTVIGMWAECCNDSAGKEWLEVLLTINAVVSRDANLLNK
jgi:hypothetical protein